MKLKKSLLLVFLPAVLIISCCSSENAIQEVIGRSATAPVFLDCRAVSGTEILFRFSRPVRMVSLFLDAGPEVISCEEGEEILVTLSEPLGVGVKITADILVEDENRNTLNVLVPFRSRNDRIPALLINEIRTEGANVSNAVTAKTEFVEFVAKSAGNLGALQVFIAGYSADNPVYEFPPVEVKAGEYIVLHLRTPSPDCADETADNLAFSGGNEALPSARDFWIPGSQKLIHKDDVVCLLDQDEKIVDVVFLSTTSGSSWSKTAFSDFARIAAEQGAWFPNGSSAKVPGTYALAPSDAVSSGSTTTTRTICRDESLAAGGSADCWYITASSSATPGTANSVKRFVP